MHLAPPVLHGRALDPWDLAAKAANVRLNTAAAVLRKTIPTRIGRTCERSVMDDLLGAWMNDSRRLIRGFSPPPVRLGFRRCAGWAGRIPRGRLAKGIRTAPPARLPDRNTF